MSPDRNSPELIELFDVYTSSPTSIGAHLAGSAARAHADAPLIVVTSHDVAVYPGGGRPPAIQSFRVGNRGFKEITAISHLGPAMGTLSELKATGDEVWRSDAERLLNSVLRARTANSASLWEDHIAVEAWRGRADRIAAMVDYTCGVTASVLRRSLDDDSYLCAANLRRDFLDGPSPGLPVPINRVMIATFFLVGMDIAHRLISWFDRHNFDWGSVMVIVAGQQGRPSAGVTLESNSISGVIVAASRGRLPMDRVYIVPHAPTFPMYDSTNTAAAIALESDYRRLWAGLAATSRLGAVMFDGYPRYEPRRVSSARLATDTRTVDEKPSITAPDDWRSMITRMRVLLEDPRQLLSGAVTDYASEQLIRSGNDPTRLVVPGLDAEPYPNVNVDHGTGGVVDHHRHRSTLDTKHS